MMFVIFDIEVSQVFYKLIFDGKNPTNDFVLYGTSIFTSEENYLLQYNSKYFLS
jgi:hypothetical protein